MKKIAVVAMIALGSLAPFAGAAQGQTGSPAGTKVEQRSAPASQSNSQRIKKQRWKKGGKYGGQGSTLTNYSSHNLKAPPKGHRWVRDGNDFLLVATGTGIIASIVSGAAK